MDYDMTTTEKTDTVEVDFSQKPTGLHEFRISNDNEAGASNIKKNFKEQESMALNDDDDQALNDMLEKAGRLASLMRNISTNNMAGINSSGTDDVLDTNELASPLKIPIVGQAKPNDLGIHDGPVTPSPLKDTPKSSDGHGLVESTKFAVVRDPIGTDVGVLQHESGLPPPRSVDVGSIPCEVSSVGSDSKSHNSINGQSTILLEKQFFNDGAHDKGGKSLDKNCLLFQQQQQHQKSSIDEIDRKAEYQLNEGRKENGYLPFVPTGMIDFQSSPLPVTARPALVTPPMVQSIDDRWEKISTASDGDSDYVPLVDYSSKTVKDEPPKSATDQFEKVGTAEEDDDDYVPLEDYTKSKSKSSTTMSSVTNLSEKKKKTKRKRPRSKFFRILMFLVVCLVLCYYFLVFETEEGEVLEQNQNQNNDSLNTLIEYSRTYENIVNPRQYDINIDQTCVDVRTFSQHMAFLVKRKKIITYAEEESGRKETEEDDDIEYKGKCGRFGKLFNSNCRKINSKS